MTVASGRLVMPDPDCLGGLLEHASDLVAERKNSLRMGPYLGTFRGDQSDAAGWSNRTVANERFAIC